MRRHAILEGDPTSLTDRYVSQNEVMLLQRTLVRAYIGRYRQIWLRVFGRWPSSTSFRLTDPFELQRKPTSIKDRLLFRRHLPQTLPLTS